MPLDIANQVLENRKAELMGNLKAKRNSEIFCFFASITRASVNDLCSLLNGNTQKPKKIDIIIDSGGGDIDAAYHMSKILSEVATERLSFIVPRMAKSAATLMVCGGDEILMGNSSELGPLDPQLQLRDGSWISGLSVRSTLDLIEEEVDKKHFELASILGNQLSPLHVGEMNRSLKISKEYLEKLLLSRMFKTKNIPKDDLDKITKKLTTGYTHHSYIIDFEEARSLKLNVGKMSGDEWSMVWEIYMINQKQAQLQDIRNSLAEAQFLRNLSDKI